MNCMKSKCLLIFKKAFLWRLLWGTLKITEPSNLEKISLWGLLVGVSKSSLSLLSEEPLKKKEEGKSHELSPCFVPVLLGMLLLLLDLFFTKTMWK